MTILRFPTSIPKTDISSRRPGISAMVRLQDEADWIEDSILSVAGVYDEIDCFVQPTLDDTIERLQRLNLPHLRIIFYPHRSWPNGDGYDKQNPNDPNSRTYFYNWCLAHTRYQWVSKWDGDMVALPRFGSLKNDLDGYDVVIEQAYEMTGSGSMYLATAPLTGLEVRHFRVTEHTRYVNGAKCEMFTNQPGGVKPGADLLNKNTDRNTIQPPRILHFKWVKPLASIIKAWPKDWSKDPHFMRIIANKALPDIRYGGPNPILDTSYSTIPPRNDPNVIPLRAVDFRTLRMEKRDAKRLEQECDELKASLMLALSKNEKVRIGFKLWQHEQKLISATNTNDWIHFMSYLKPQHDEVLEKHLIAILKDIEEVISRKSFDPNCKPITLMTWGYRDAGMLTRLASQFNFVKVSRHEDGFVRSIGPHQVSQQGYSLVTDEDALYFDYSKASVLEKIILETRLQSDSGEFKRAKELIEKMRLEGVTKYGRDDPNRKISKLDGIGDFCLVVGQLELDQSIQFGSPQIKTNAQLVSAVRKAYPERVVVYKPHPEVMFREAIADTHLTQPSEIADITLLPEDGTITQALSYKPIVCTMTSGAGMEALIHGCDVHTFGGPFYAGWGLTKDELPFPRRSNYLGDTRSLEELFYATYVKYSSYMSPNYFAPIELDGLFNELLA